MSAIDGTVILDTIVGSNAFSPVVQVTLNNPSSFRITGVTFQYDPNVTAKNQNGAVIVGGTSNNFRLDHCHFSLLYGGHLEITGSIFGVIDHTIFDVRSGTSGMINLSHPTYAPSGDSHSYSFGDGSWTDTAQFGTNRFIFVEDVTITSYGANSTDGVIDSSYGGGRWVARYCQFNNTRALAGHGTESSGRARGCRAVEAYNNNFIINSKFDLGEARSGSRLYYNNTYAYTNGYIPSTPVITCYRLESPFKYWGGASGNSPWDYNDNTDQTGNGFGGGSNGLYASGTDNSGITGNTFLTDTTNNLSKWRFPNGATVPARGYLVVFASGKNRTNVVGRLHTNFQLNSSGEYLALVDPRTNVVSDFYPLYPPQQTDISYGRDRADPSLTGYFLTPTPGTDNSTSGGGFGPEVQFSKPSGTFTTASNTSSNDLHGIVSTCGPP